MLIKLKCPFRMLIFANSGGGKSYFLSKLIENQEEMFETPVKKIYYFAKYPSSINENIRDKVKYFQGLPNESHWENQSNEHLLICLDDMQHSAFNSKDVPIIFQQGRHHNVSIVILTQNLFPRSANSFARDISLNCSYIVLLKCCRDLSSIHLLSKQMFPGKSSRLSDIYYKFVRDPYTFLLIDCNVDCNDLLRIRSNIFSKDFVEIFLSQEQIETIQNHEETCESFGKVFKFTQRLQDDE